MRSVDINEVHKILFQIIIIKNQTTVAHLQSLCYPEKNSYVGWNEEGTELQTQPTERKGCAERLRATDMTDRDGWICKKVGTDVTERKNVWKEQRIQMHDTDVSNRERRKHRTTDVTNREGGMCRKRTWAVDKINREGVRYRKRVRVVRVRTEKQKNSQSLLVLVGIRACFLGYMQEIWILGKVCLPSGAVTQCFHLQSLAAPVGGSGKELSLLETLESHCSLRKPELIVEPKLDYGSIVCSAGMRQLFFPFLWITCEWFVPS